MDNSYNNKKEEGIPEDISLGSLLRRSREELHIDLDDVVRVTRIRRHYLEALEDEVWSELPPFQVFVKGFLRTYAEFLGLDKEMVLNYYLRAYPFQKYEPPVLKEIRSQSARWYLIIIPVLALALIAAIIYLKDISFFKKPFQYLEEHSLIEKTENAVEDEDNKGQDDKKKEVVFSKDEKVVEKVKETALKSKSVEENIVLKEPTIPIEKKDEKPLSPRFVLTANVNSKTWIGITIDDESVKEYLFQPGENIRWTAVKGFDILVGNAGGIEFSLNGKEVGNLGPEGKVLRLKLPEGYE